jgi:GTP-binding protein Era
LLNALIGEKLSIVSRRAQTTRHRIIGILTRTDTQYVFVDTPGFQTRYGNALNQVMNRGVRQALAEVDVVLFVVEAGRFDERDRAVRQLVPADCPLIIVVNKIDQLKDKARLLPFLADLAREGDFAAIVPVSATRGAQLDELLAETRKHLPNNEFLFGEDEITDRSERFLAAEYIREKLFRLIGDELPYAATVEVEKFVVDGELRRISAAIVVDRGGHKAIIIGSGGETVKRIASEARQDMERMFGGPVFLEVFVKVKSGWADDERLLKSLGYE